MTEVVSSASQLMKKCNSFISPIDFRNRENMYVSPQISCIECGKQLCEYDTTIVPRYLQEKIMKESDIKREVKRRKLLEDPVSLKSICTPCWLQKQEIIAHSTTNTLVRYVQECTERTRFEPRKWSFKINMFIDSLFFDPPIKGTVYVCYGRYWDRVGVMFGDSIRISDTGVIDLAGTQYFKATKAVLTDSKWINEWNPKELLFPLIFQEKIDFSNAVDMRWCDQFVVVFDEVVEDPKLYAKCYNIIMQQGKDTHNIDPEYDGHICWKYS